VAFRRSRRSHRGSSRKTRKTYWNAAAMVGQEIELFQGDVATSWVKWPSGLFDAQVVSPEGSQVITPNDETWIRSITSSTVSLRLQGALPETLPCQVNIGFITWDAPNSAVAADYDNQVVGNAPSPTLDGSADWIQIIPFVFTHDAVQEIAQAETFIVSRAMRKLPPMTGVLACVSALQLLDGEASTTIDWSFFCRYALKAGYYSA